MHSAGTTIGAYYLLLLTYVHTLDFQNEKEQKAHVSL